jgi:hypothetical protein
VSVEVKTAACTPGTIPVHTITSLDQLDMPEVGQLYLFSFHVVDDALAANSLPLLVEQVFTTLSSDPDALVFFSERLAKVGYNPADGARYLRPLRVVSEGLYRVDESFPRLTRESFGSGLPPGIAEVSYTLSMGACLPWRIASSSSDPPAEFLRHSRNGLATD